MYPRVEMPALAPGQSVLAAWAIEEITNMLRNMLRLGSRSQVANENAPASLVPAELPNASNVRALATGAALAVSIDTSPAVLLTIYDYAHRYRDRPKRTA